MQGYLHWLMLQEVFLSIKYTVANDVLVLLIEMYKFYCERYHYLGCISRNKFSTTSMNTLQPGIIRVKTFRLLQPRIPVRAFTTMLAIGINPSCIQKARWTEFLASSSNFLRVLSKSQRQWQLLLRSSILQSLLMRSKTFWKFSSPYLIPFGVS